MKVTKLNTPNKGKVDHYFLASDWHSKALNKPTYKMLKHHAKMFPKSQRKLIINGDFLDCPHFMRRSDAYKQNCKGLHGFENYFLPKSFEEFDWGNEILNELEEIFSEIIFVEGNHDWRYDDFRESKDCPETYKEYFDYKSQLWFKERNIKHVNYNDWLDIGDLSITHGMYHGSTCHKKHYEACGGRNVAFGHVHHFACKSFVSRGKSKYAWSLPAMCDLNPCYIKNRETNWDNGYAHFYVFDNGAVDYKTHLLTNNRYMTLGSGLVVDTNTL